MKTSDKGKIALAVSEGIADTAYLDTVKVWTVGIGHAETGGPPNPREYIGKTISLQQIFDMFTKDLVTYENIINRNVKVKLEQHEFDALVHFVYNIGEPNFKKSKLLSNLNAGNKTAAFKTGFHGWLKQKELKSRRDKERDMAMRAVYGGTVATLFTADKKGKLKTKGSIDLSKQGNLFGNTTATDKPVTKPEASNPVNQDTNSFGFMDFVMWILSLFSKTK